MSKYDRPGASHTFIVLGAGYGKRMGKTIPKMLIPVRGKPILYWTLKNLENCPIIHQVILTVPPDYRKIFKEKIQLWNFKKIYALVNGGKERTDSTRNALKHLPKECQWVGIHDGARPFVAQDLLKKCLRAAKSSGAAILGVPAKETIKMVSKNSIIRQTVPRDQCWLAQTPQIFRRDLAEKIHGLHGRTVKNTANYTDDASIAEAIGIRVRVVPGSYENIKITTPEDLVLAEFILKRRNQ
jgi:2-C-methyl-D-erythritol 4-phosphate cytidylyltransferase